MSKFNRNEPGKLWICIGKLRFDGNPQKIIDWAEKEHRFDLQGSVFGKNKNCFQIYEVWYTPKKSSNPEVFGGQLPFDSPDWALYPGDILLLWYNPKARSIFKMFRFEKAKTNCLDDGKKLPTKKEIMQYEQENNE